MKGGPVGRPLLLLERDEKICSSKSAVVLMRRRLQTNEAA
jgi:hypothetical protein